MKKSQLPNSSWVILFLLFVSVISACKAKQKNKANEQQAVESADAVVTKDTVQENQEVIIHRPGVINQAELDSIKAAKRLQKRGHK